MAVYTKVSCDEVVQFLCAYDIGSLQELAGIQQGVENSNYNLRTTKGHYILTLFEKRIRPEDIPFFVALTESLAKQKIPCPLPVKAKNGEALQCLKDHPAIIVTFLEGCPADKITAPMCAEVGKALAELHMAGQSSSLSRQNNLGLVAWPKLYAQSAGRADEVKGGLQSQLGKELSYLQQSWPCDLPVGLIHADLFPDNVLFKQEKLCGLIDFYFACTDFFAYDLAIVLNAWCFEDDLSFNLAKAQALLRSYQAIRPLCESEKMAMPILARGAAVRFLLTRLHDWLHQVPDALVKAKDPVEYLKRLQFHQQVRNISAYGLDA